MGNNASSRALASTAPADAREMRVSGAFRDADEVSARLQYAAKNYHLVSPATSCGLVPEGCSIALSTVLVDIENETYDVGGFGPDKKVGLAKSALDKIAAAAGISWDARLSGRLDDGSDPSYVMWRAVGQVRHLDGSVVQLLGTKEMDLRHGSAQVEALVERYGDKLAKWRKSGQGREPKAPTAQIREMRLHIVGHAESKARLRAIRSLGVRSAYTKSELKKPFVVAKIMWTGQSDDPELRRAFAMKQADAMLGGHRALYGEAASSAPAPAQAAAPTSIAPQLGARRPPPVGTSFDAADPDAIDIPAAAGSEPKAKHDAKSGKEAKPTASEQPTPATNRGPLCRFGKQKDIPLQDLDDEDLEWYSGALKKSVEDPEKARFKAANETAYRETLAEYERRNGVPDEGSDDDADDLDRGDDADDY